MNPAGSRRDTCHDKTAIYILYYVFFSFTNRNPPSFKSGLILDF